MHRALAITFIWALAAPGCKTVTTKGASFYIPEGEQHSYLETRLEQLEELAKRYPKVPDHQYQIAAIHFEQADYDESAAALEKAIALAEEQPNPRYHYHLGRCQLRQHELEKAESSFRRAVELTREERYSGPRAALAYVQALRGEREEAIANFKRCIGVDPQETSFYYFLGALHDMKGDDSGAIHYLREYLDRGGTQYRSKAIFVLERLGVHVASKDLYGLDERIDEPAPPPHPSDSLPPQIDGEF